MAKRLFSLVTLLFAIVLASNGVAFGWGSTGGDGEDYGQLQETAVFFNNSGIRIVHGMAVVLDLDSTASSTDPVKIAPTAETTLGACVEALVATADSDLAVGVVKVAANNQTPVIVVTKGPIDTLVQDSSEAIAAGGQVGTAGTGTAGLVGAGTNLGVALEAGDGTNASYLFIWVNPSNSD